jgi:hypothetical protein
MDPDSDPDPAIFVIDLQDTNRKLILKKFFCLLLFENTFTTFFKDKKSKILDSEPIPLTKESGSGSRRPKNIRIRIRRIRKTGSNCIF